METFSLEQAAASLELVLGERRNTTESKRRTERGAMSWSLLTRANDSGLGNFTSFEALLVELQRAEPWEESLRKDLHNDWISFEHYFDVEHFSALSTETDSLFRYGSIVAAYALFETFLRDLCELLCKHPITHRQVHEPITTSAGDVRQYRNFLESVLGKDVAAASWIKIEVFFQMRHCIAHRAGIVDHRLMPKYDHFFGPNRIASIQRAKLVLSPSAVIQFSIAIHGLFDELAKAIAKRTRLRLV